MRMEGSLSSSVPQQGFGLLEAIVALVLLSVTGAILFDWIRISLASAYRAESKVVELQFRTLALEWANTINPASTPRGETELAPGVRVTWRSDPVVPLTTVVPFPGGTSTPFDAGLYRLHLQVERPDESVVELELNRLGIRRNAP